MYASSAWSLIHQLFGALELGPDDVVLVPDYHPVRTTRAIRAAGARIRFFRVKRDLTIDLEDLERSLTPDVKVLYVIHHFGFPQPIAELARLADARGITLIEDCTEALFSEDEGRPLGSFGAHAIFCLQSVLPVPNGGLLLATGKVYEKLSSIRFRPCELADVARPSLMLLADAVKARTELLGMSLELIGRTADALFGHEDAGAEGIFDPDARFDMAPLTRHILERIEFDVVHQRRRASYMALVRRLEGWITPLKGDLPAGVCPWFLPIAVEDKDAAIRELRARGVGAIDPGTTADAEVDERRSKDARWLREHAAGIPAHQELMAEQIAHVVRSMRELGLQERTGVVHALEDAGAKIFRLFGPDKGPNPPPPLSKSG